MRFSHLLANVCAGAHPALSTVLGQSSEALRRRRVEKALAVVARSRLTPAQSARLLARAFELQDDLIRSVFVGEQREHVTPLLCHAALSLAGQQRCRLIVYALAGSGQLLSWRDYETGALVDVESQLRDVLRDVVCTAAARVVVILAADNDTELSATCARLRERLSGAFAAIGISVRGIYAVGPQAARDLATGRVEWLSE